MDNASDIFEKNYHEYCSQIAKIDLKSIKERLGFVNEGGRMFLRFFNRNYMISGNGILDVSGNRPEYMVCVILARYILMCPDHPYNDTDWVAFKDFKRASHFTNINYFSSDTERVIESNFAGKLNELNRACEKLEGSHHEMKISYDISIQLTALPRVSLLLLFNDRDEEFPAKCKVLFQKHAEYYLDPESLAMTSAFLARSLREHIMP